MNKTILVLLAQTILFVFLVGCQKEEAIHSSQVLVLINTSTPESRKGTEKVVPYLEHFGVQFKTMDLAGGRLPTDFDDHALVIVSHAGITAGDNGLKSGLEKYLDQCQSKGTGILSFDPLLPDWLLKRPGKEYGKDQHVGELIFSGEPHYITGYHQPGEKKELFGYMSVPELAKKEGLVLLSGNDHPLLIVSSRGGGKVAQWTSQDWMYRSVLGPLGGLDDCLWKSIVWAARKPFAMQALPPVATMRVDDVVGSGRQQWNESPFHWVKTVNKYGLKPWLGLFIYNLTPEGIEELREIIGEGSATASPHALGRPPRPESLKEHFDAYYEPQMIDEQMLPDYYYPDALPYLSEYYDEFIFFDHNNRKPWPGVIAEKALNAVDDWYHKAGSLPMSCYLIPHWGEMGSNMVTHVYDQWGIEFIALRKLDQSWGDQATPYSGRGKDEPLRMRPFMLYDEPVVGKPKEGALTSRASYNADFTEFAGKKFFNFSSLITDITGYEWQPDNDVESTAERGVETLRRGLESKALAVLFTHETDYIYKIKPENWDRIFSRISAGISGYNPVYLTTDDALKMVRAFQTSEIKTCDYRERVGQLEVKISGEADVPTSVSVYTGNEEDIKETRIEIPAFKNEVIQIYRIGPE